MKETVVPNRNKIFASLIQAVALSVATRGGKQEVAIAMGVHSGDHQIYPDCRVEFRDADMEAFKIGNWDSELVTVYTPYLELNKFTILEDGQKSCDILGLDFNEVYKRTNTSYKPIRITTEHKWFKTDDEGEIYGDEQTTIVENWYSDYKSAASVERIEAFIKLGRPDPVAYADETGPVTWEVAKTHVEQVLAEHNS
jgi:7-cyano-7-deazaguanine synthase